MSYEINTKISPCPKLGSEIIGNLPKPMGQHMNHVLAHMFKEIPNDIIHVLAHMFKEIPNFL